MVLFRKALTRWLNGGAIEVQANAIPTTTQVSIDLVHVRAMEANVLCALGDAVHNLSCALDHVSSEVAYLFGGDVERVTFPFHRDREQLKTELGRPVYGNLPDDVKELILEHIKPFRDGNFTLWALRKLDNIDKHRLIIPATAVNQIIGLQVVGTQGGGWSGPSIECQGVVNQRLFTMSEPVASISFEDMIYTVMFHEPKIFEGPAPIFGFIKLAGAGVIHAVQQFTALLYGEDAEPK